MHYRLCSKANIYILQIITKQDHAKSVKQQTHAVVSLIYTKLHKHAESELGWFRSQLRDV